MRKQRLRQMISIWLEHWISYYVTELIVEENCKDTMITVTPCLAHPMVDKQFLSIERWDGETTVHDFRGSNKIMLVYLRHDVIHCDLLECSGRSSTFQMSTLLLSISFQNIGGPVKIPKSCFPAGSSP